MCLGSLGKVVRVWDEGGMPMAEVDASGHSLPACLLYHPDVTVGDDVLIHMGFVVDVMDGQTAADARSLRAGVVPPAPGA